MNKDIRGFEDWMSDLSEFISSRPVAPRADLDHSTQKTILSLLNPHPLLVFVKLALVSLVASSFSLFICPQYGLGVEGMGLMPIFMKISPQFCQFACGALFVGMGVLIATLVLTLDELRILRRTRFLQVSALTAAMLGGFICMGSATLFKIEWLWFFGGFSGGLISLHGGVLLRKYAVA